MIGRVLLILVLGFCCIVWLAGLVLVPMEAFANPRPDTITGAAMIWLMTISAICLYFEV